MVRWIHIYYVKGDNLDDMNCPKQASLVVPKIFAIRRFSTIIGGWDQVINTKGLFRLGILTLIFVVSMKQFGGRVFVEPKNLHILLPLFTYIFSCFPLFA